MVRYSDELIDEIRNSNDIVDIISQYVVLKRSGRNFFGLCPFHKEKSPSFSVSPDKQIFHCFGCGVGGDIFRFLGKIEGIEFRETIEILAEKAGIILPTLDDSKENRIQELKSKVYEINLIAAEFYHKRLYQPISKIAQDYIKKRKLDNNTLKTFLIGYAGNFDELYQELKKHGFTEEEILASSLVNKSDNGKFIDRFRKRLMFPIKDVRDRIIAFGGRVLDDSKPKYINSPENLVYSKGRNLYGLNVAKQSKQNKIIIVEGYMDAISLYQRGIDNVVASLGTALTESQGRILRKYASEIIIGYDSDSAGQAATMRGLEILQNLGYDIRILQLEGAKDPDEFVIKYGTGRFNLYVDQSISLVEFKVKMLKKNLNLEIANDKIKFLNEVANILSKINNEIEREIYIEKIAIEHNISKEAIYSQINKLIYKNNIGSKILERPRINIIKTKEGKEQITEAVIKRENLLIYLLLNYKLEAYEKLKNQISPDYIRFEKNKKIIEKLYEEFKKGNSNNVLDLFKDEEIINHLTYILAYDFEITDYKKAIEDILSIYKKENMIKEKNNIIERLEDLNITDEERADLEKNLSVLIIELSILLIFSTLKVRVAGA